MALTSSYPPSAFVFGIAPNYLFLHFLYFFIMAAPVKTPKDDMETRLLALFQNAGVPNDQLDRLADLGIKSVALFANIVDTKTELRPFLMKALG